MVQELAFIIGQVGTICGLDMRTMRDWLQRGFIKASARSVASKGKPLLFRFSDVFACWLFRSLRDNGVSFNVILQISKALESTPVTEETSTLIVSRGTAAFVSREAAKEKIADDPSAFVIDVFGSAERLRDE